MRNRILFNAFVLVALLLSTNLMAQGGKTMVSVSAAQFFKNPKSSSTTPSFIGASSLKQTIFFDPLIALRVERQIAKSFSIGLSLHSALSKAERTVDNGFVQIFNGGVLTNVPNPVTNQLIKARTSGMSFNLKGYFHSSENFDVYVNGALGVLGARENIENLNATVVNNATGFNGRASNQTSVLSFTGLAELSFGMRYFMANSLGIYGEISTTRFAEASGGVGQIGVIYRF